MNNDTQIDQEISRLRDEYFKALDTNNKALAERLLGQIGQWSQIKLLKYKSGRLYNIESI